LSRREQHADFDQLSVGDYLIVLWRSKGFLIGFCSIAVSSALIFSLLSPKIFESTVTLLPPTDTNAGMGTPAAALMGQASVLVPGISAFNNKQDILVTILQSRTLAENIVDRYKLATYYRLDTSREAAGLLRDATQVSVAKSGLISVTISDRDPRMAAELANGHAVALDRLLKLMDVRQNSAKRRFILDRLAETEGQLRAAENALMRFQEENRAVSLQEQAEGAIHVAAQLKHHPTTEARQIAPLSRADVGIDRATNQMNLSQPAFARGPNRQRRALVMPPDVAGLHQAILRPGRFDQAPKRLKLSTGRLLDVQMLARRDRLFAPRQVLPNFTFRHDQLDRGII